jgi:transcriptional regulator with XRE-family HTH domain
MEDTMSQDTTGDHPASQGSAEISDGIFARRLSALRKTAELTQQQLADAMSASGNTMHRSAIAKIEAGDRAVSVGEAVQLAGVLGIDLAELVTEPTDSEQERAHRRRVEAQVMVRSLQHLAAERYKLLEEQKILYENAVDRLEAAQRRLAELGGESASLPDPHMEAILASQSVPLEGNDDQ